MIERLLGVVVLVACGDSAPGGGDGGGGGVDGGVVESGATEVDAGQAPDSAPAGDTWESYAETFFATYCTECHSTAMRDYRTRDDVERDAARIRCGVAATRADGCGPSPRPMQFPIGDGPFPDAAERTRLVTWIDQGLP